MTENWNIRVPIKQRIPPRTLGFIRRSIRDGQKLFLYLHKERFMAIAHQHGGRHGITECVGWLEISPVALEDYQTRTWDDLRKKQELVIHDDLVRETQQKILRSTGTSVTEKEKGNDV
jgi:hypothetical protein